MIFVDSLYAVCKISNMIEIKSIAGRACVVDVRGFVAYFGGQAAMRSLWEKHGLSLTKGAQDKWVLRGAVPTSRVMEAVMVCRKRRVHFNFSNFIRVNKK